MKPDDILAAFHQLAEAQAKEHRAKVRFDKAVKEQNEAMQAHTEALNYLNRCTARMVELSKGAGRELDGHAELPKPVPPTTPDRRIGPQGGSAAAPPNPAAPIQTIKRDKRG